MTCSTTEPLRKERARNHFHVGLWTSPAPAPDFLDATTLMRYEIPGPCQTAQPWNLVSYNYFGLSSMQEENMSVTLIKNATNVINKPV